MLRRKAARPVNGLADSGSGGTRRATGRPRSVITTSWPWATSASSTDRFWRASRIPAVLMRSSVLLVAQRCQSPHAAAVIERSSRRPQRRHRSGGRDLELPGGRLEKRKGGGREETRGQGPIGMPLPASNVRKRNRRLLQAP